MILSAGWVPSWDCFVMVETNLLSSLGDKTGNFTGRARWDGTCGHLHGRVHMWRKEHAAPLTVRALHLPVVARLYEADVPQVEDACDDLQHLRLDVARDPDHVHGFLETTTQIKRQ